MSLRCFSILPNLHLLTRLIIIWPLSLTDLFQISIDLRILPEGLLMTHLCINLQKFQELWVSLFLLLISRWKHGGRGGARRRHLSLRRLVVNFLLLLSVDRLDFVVLLRALTLDGLWHALLGQDFVLVWWWFFGRILRRRWRRRWVWRRRWIIGLWNRYFFNIYRILRILLLRVQTFSLNFNQLSLITYTARREHFLWSLCLAHTLTTHRIHLHFLIVFSGFVKVHLPSRRQTLLF